VQHAGGGTYVAVLVLLLHVCLLLLTVSLSCAQARKVEEYWNKQASKGQTK
jgi:hypothetical protein